MPLPLILYVLPPREGHMGPGLQISSYLVSRGFDVTITGDAKWSTAISAIGAHPCPLTGLWGCFDDMSKWGKMTLVPVPKERALQSLCCGYAKMMPSGLETLRHGLIQIRYRLGGGDVLKGQTVVIVSDTSWSGTVPIKLGADLPAGFERTTVKTVGISLMPRCWGAPERPPWGSGLPYDISEEGLARNVKAYSEQYIEEAEDVARWMLEAVNCSQSLDDLYRSHDATEKVRHPFLDAVTVCHDVVLQMGLPSFEFPVPNDPPHFKFIGSLPAKPISQDLELPDWYAEVLANSPNAEKPIPESRKRVVLVAQGTEVLDHRETVIPCLRGLAERDDTIVVAVLCQKGASLTQHMDLFEGGRLPPNARVVDYLPYDAVLAHADVFVSNSGYGGVGHAIANAVPLVQVGSVFDKADIGQRVQYTGLGVYLADASRTPEGIAAAVDEVLTQPTYQQRAAELRAEARAYDPFQIIEKEILAVSR